MDSTTNAYKQEKVFGKVYAEYTAEDGKWERKVFPTAQEALQFESIVLCGGGCDDVQIPHPNYYNGYKLQ